MPNPVQQSMSLTIRLYVCSWLWVIFIGYSHCSGAPGCVTRVGPQAHLPGEGANLPALSYQNSPQEVRLLQTCFGVPQTRVRRNVPGSWGSGNGALHFASGNESGPSSASAALDDVRQARFPL